MTKEKINWTYEKLKETFLKYGNKKLRTLQYINYNYKYEYECGCGNFPLYIRIGDLKKKSR